MNSWSFFSNLYSIIEYNHKNRGYQSARKEGKEYRRLDKRTKSIASNCARSQESERNGCETYKKKERQKEALDGHHASESSQSSRTSNSRYKMVQKRDVYRNTNAINSEKDTTQGSNGKEVHQADRRERETLSKRGEGMLFQ